MDEASTVMSEIMEGSATPAQFGSFVTALRCNGETVEEIAGLAAPCGQKPCACRLMNRSSIPAAPAATPAAHLIFPPLPHYCCRLRLKVAKHGNRAMSSRCGSADVLEALGVKNRP